MSRRQHKAVLEVVDFDQDSLRVVVAGHLMNELHGIKTCPSALIPLSESDGAKWK